MPLELFDVEQGSDAWHQCRLGIPTASKFKTVMAHGKGGGPSITRATYMRELAGERLTGTVQEGYTNYHMERGHTMEDDARNLYAFVHEQEITRVGFIRNGDKGGSPDALCGERGLLEIKTAIPSVLIEVLESDKVPPEHLAQIQGNLWVSERDWLDLVIYWPKMPLFRKRIFRDEPYIANMARAIREFNLELTELESRIRKLMPA